ncbi:hypothetical protein J5X84_36065 [Streptosporangiaceae bacterium NEAU-GS5]|nr:hypothetical protein [Streptosporangiaceae bacterium NEAU-GS5]
MSELRWVGSLLIHLSMLPAVAFVVIYAVLVRWRQTRLGPFVLALTSTLAAVLLLTSIGQFAFRMAPWFLILRLVVFAAVPVVLYWQLWILIRTQVGVRRLRLSRKHNPPEEGL